MTISTRLAIPVQAGSRALNSIGAAEALPWPRNTMPITMSSTPGINVPSTSPALDRPATAFIPREDTRTPVQNRVTMMMAVYSPFAARAGLITYAKVLAT